MYKYNLLSLRFLVLVLLPFLSIAQSSNSVRIIANPFIYRVGDINNQYTNVENEYIQANYFNKPGFEFGLGYRFEKNEYSINAGLSWMQRRHQVNLILFNPDPSFSGLVLNFHDIQLKENLLSFRLGGQYRFNSSMSLGFNLSFYGPLEFSSNMSNEKIHYTRSGYNHISTPDTTYTELSFRLENEIKRSTGSGLIIPELYLSYEIYKNLNFILGCKFKFWTSKDDWLLSVRVSGFTEPSDSDNSKLLFDSGIKNQGFYSFIGLTYDLPLNLKGSLTKEQKN